jgi:hypothetical protein
MSFFGDFWCAFRTLASFHCPKFSDFFNFFTYYYYFIKPEYLHPSSDLVFRSITPFSLRWTGTATHAFMI